MILITGATGSVGHELAKVLASRGIEAKAMVRSSAGAQKLAGLTGIQPVTGDFDDPASLDMALDGIDSAFLLTNSSEHAEAQQLAFVAAAGRADVRHIVKLSQLHADTSSPVRFLRYHAHVEQAIRESGINYTFLQPNLFMQALLSLRDTIVGQGKLFAPIGDARISLVDVRDIAECAATALLSTDARGHTYDITGPEALTHSDIADKIGAVIGRPVQFVDIPAVAMHRALLSAGFPLWQAEGLLEDYAHYSRREAEAVSDDVERLTGRSARALDEFLSDNRQALVHNDRN